MSSLPSSDGRTPQGWEIVEEDSYQRAAAQFGSLEYFDDALAPVEFALHRNPKGFPEIPGYPGLHLAKTKLRFIGLEIVPSFRMWIRVDNDKRRVHKLWIELSPPEDMGFAEDPWDEHESPFPAS